MEEIGGCLLLIVGLVVAVWLIVIYFTAMGSILTVAGPEILTVSTLLALTVIPIYYGRALFAVYGRPGLRSLALIPVVALLALVYADLAWLAWQALDALGLESQLAALLEAWLRPAVYDSAINRPILEWWVNVLPPRTPEALVLLVSSASKLALLTPALLLGRGLVPTRRSPTEPAFIQYFFGEATEELRAACELAAEGLRELAEHIGLGLKKAIWGWWALATWPFVLAIGAGLVLPTLATLLAAVSLFALHWTVHGLIHLGVWWAAWALKLAERAVIRARAGYARCPHSGCNEKMPLPVFRCSNPDCGARHDQLVPDRHGLLRRRCQCGTQLPTLFWFGKGRLPCECRECHRPMEAALFQGSFHLPIYGAKSAGKTTLTLSTLVRVLSGKVPGLGGALLGDTPKESYQRVWLPNFKQGRPPDVTRDMVPDALPVLLERAGGLPLSLCLYDVAGEATEQTEHLNQHNWLRHIDGMMLVIDPLCFPAVRQAYEEDGGVVPAEIRSLRLDDLLNRLINALATQGAQRRSRRAEPLAVVFTRLDVPAVQRALGVPLSSRPLPQDWRLTGGKTSMKLREWLGEQDPALLHTLESTFARVRFFAVSATGRSDRRPEPFDPKEAETPLCWLLSHRVGMVFPRRAWVAGRLAELASAAAVLGPSVVLPAGLLVFWVLPAWEGWVADQAEIVQVGSDDPEPADEPVVVPEPPPPPPRPAPTRRKSSTAARAAPSPAPSASAEPAPSEPAPPAALELAPAAPPSPAATPPMELPAPNLAPAEAP